MDKRAHETLQRHLRGTLLNCRVKGRWPLFEPVDHVASLAKEIVKAVKPLTLSDAFGILYREIYRSLSSLSEDATGTLESLIGEESTNRLERDLMSLFASIPRSYQIMLPLPRTQIEMPTVELSPGVSIRSFDSADNIPEAHRQPYGLTGALLAGTLTEYLEERRPYLCFDVQGFCNANHHNATTLRAYSYVKIMTQQAIFRGLFVTTTKLTRNILQDVSVNLSRMLYSDHAAPKERLASIKLSLDASRFLQTLEFAADNEVMKATNKAARENALVASLRSPSLLLSSNAAGANRIRSASEWCFDSFASESETVSFIQTCIGLEALFGDDSAGDGLTKTLADRCAYVIAKDISQRKVIRERFCELYKVRSKLVHGNALRLDGDGQELLHWGQKALQYGIHKELMSLRLIT